MAEYDRSMVENQSQNKTLQPLYPSLIELQLDILRLA